MKKESTLGKIVNLKGIGISFGLAFGLNYLAMGLSYGEFNPLKYMDAFRKESLRNESKKHQQKVFPSQLYNKVAGEDGLIDSTEFASFYSKADSVGGIYYPKLSDFYNKAE